MKYDVFISYSRKDTAIADQICAAFDKAGISYFIDRQGIGGGFEFPTVLAENIINSQLFLFLGSKNSYESKFTNNEVLFAFNKKTHNSILPYLIDNTTLPINYQFTFASINQRNIIEHPIETVLIDDIFRMLGRTRPKAEPISPDESITETEPKESINTTEKTEEVEESNNPVDSVFSFSESQENTIFEMKEDTILKIAKKGNKHGFVDKRGNVVIPFVYDFAMSFHEGLAIVGNDNKLGIIDEQGKIIIPIKYDSVQGSFSEGLAAAEINGTHGYLDKQGKIAIPFIFDSAYGFSEGLAAVKKDKKWGFIDPHGNIAIPFVLDAAYNFSEGLAAVKKGNKWGYIDHHGKIAIPFDFESTLGFSEGLAALSKDRKWGYMDIKGNIVIPFVYLNAGSFRKGKALVTKKSFLGLKQYYIDKNGNKTT